MTDAPPGDEPPEAPVTPAHPATAMTLQELILHRKNVLNLTYDELIRNAEQAGHKIARSTLHNRALQPFENMPDTETITAIAAAIKVTPEQVLNACAASIGLATVGPGMLDHDAQAIMALIENRPSAQLRALEDIIRSVTRAMDNP